MRNWDIHVILLIEFVKKTRMKTPIRPLFVLIALVLAFPSVAQTDNAQFRQSNLSSMMSGARMFQTFDNRFKGVKGSVTLFENYMPGRIILTDGQVVYHHQVNYDAYNSDLLVMKEGQEMVVSIKLVKHFILQPIDGTDTLYFTRLTTDENKLGYYQVLANHKNATLYKKHYKTLQEPTYTGAYSTGQTNSELIDNKKYVAWSTGKQLTEFKTKKQLLQYLPEYKSDLEKFIKQEKIDFKIEADLIKLFGEIDRLASRAAS
jgi:hypothetical protein